MMDTAKLLMVAALPRSAAGGATETRAEVNRARAQTAPSAALTWEPATAENTKSVYGEYVLAGVATSRLEAGKSFDVEEAKKAYAPKSVVERPSIAKRYVAIAGDTHSFKDGESISVVDTPNWKNLPSGWAYFQGNDGIQQLLAPEDFKEAPEAAQSSGWTSALGAGSKLLIIGNSGDFHGFAVGDVVTVEALEEHKANGDPMPGRLIAKGPNGNVQILYAEHYKRI
jgi:hypothetical protein